MKNFYLDRTYFKSYFGRNDRYFVQFGMKRTFGCIGVSWDRGIDGETKWPFIKYWVCIIPFFPLLISVSDDRNSDDRNFASSTSE